jgi:hypothetical protein
VRRNNRVCLRGSLFDEDVSLNDTKLCKKCGQPLRFVGNVNLNGQMLTGARCPDDKCKGGGVFDHHDWIASLQPIDDKNDKVGK